jgi:glutamine amidotransferase
MAINEVTIVDYGMGNLGSIQNMLRKIGVRHQLSSDPNRVAGAAKLILPGVGAFSQGMEGIRSRSLIPALERSVVDNGVPILGICLGMHLLTQSSEEGEGLGLGWIDASCVKFHFSGNDADQRLKIPHMGWNHVLPNPQSKLYAGWNDIPRFYFVHSYYVLCRDPLDAASTTEYGIPFASSIERGHIYGVQFHPEKSHKFGMELLSRFAAL